MTERTTVMGRLGREPQKRSTPKGEVTGFSLAQSSRILGPDGRWEDGPTTWYEVSAWDGLAENAVLSLRKGQAVIVHGTVFTHEWTGRDGETRSELRIKAAAIGHDLNTGTAVFQRRTSAAAPAPEAAPEREAAPGLVAAPALEPAWSAPLAPAPALAGAPSDGWSTIATAETPF